MITAAPDLEAARAVVDRAEATFVEEDSCIFCIHHVGRAGGLACADMGDLDEARRHIRAAERSLRLWEGTAWEASLTGGCAPMSHAPSTVTPTRERLFTDAAVRFEAAGQPLDAQRCRV